MIDIVDDFGCRYEHSHIDKRRMLSGVALESRAVGIY